MGTTTSFLQDEVLQMECQPALQQSRSVLVPDSASQRFDRLVIRAGLPPVPLHDLRHLAASLTYRATKDLKLTSQMLGHSSTAITEQVYTSVFEDVEREAAEPAAALVRVPTERPLAPTYPPRAHLRAMWATAVPSARTKPQLRIGGGAGGARTHDPGIMSPML